MTADPRAALDRLVAALEAHYHAVAGRRDPEDSAVDAAYDALADAFDIYDESLAVVYGEGTPLVLDEDDEDDDEDDLGPSGLDEDIVPDEAFDDDDETDDEDDDLLTASDPGADSRD